MSESNHPDSVNPFWDFSLEFYGQAGVSEACLALQDDLGADVNIVLYACWVAAMGADEMAPAELAEIIAVIEPWQTGVVQRLRQIRQDMKLDETMNFGDISEDLRQAIKKCELDGERIEQTVLYQSGQRDFGDVVVDTRDVADRATANIKIYLRMIFGDPPPQSQKNIEKIVSALAK